MSVELSKKQLAPLAKGESNAITVRDTETDCSYVIIPESAYKKAQPLLDLISNPEDQFAAESVNWTEQDNERRIDLITRKHDKGITEVEEEELGNLQKRAYLFRAKQAPVDNAILALLLEALENRAAEN